MLFTILLYITISGLTFVSFLTCNLLYNIYLFIGSEGIGCGVVAAVG